METFKFNGKVDDQFDEFRKFVNCLKDKSKVEIILAKNNFGNCGTVNLLFCGKFMKFYNPDQKLLDKWSESTDTNTAEEEIG